MASTAIAQGKAVISINAEETEASLVFVPDSGGEAWDMAAVNKLIAEKQIASRPAPGLIETFLAKAAKAKVSEPLEIVICRGVEPEEPAGEKVTWEAPPVPGDIAPFQEEVLSSAAPPEIYRINVEKIKHEKKIKKPAALPFMPGKEDVEISWEEKKTRVKIEVKPEVLQIKYADKGKKLGTVSPSVPGKPGKSVFGRPIPPRSADGGACLLGEGIARDKNDLSAAVSGFLRIGENWADMIPLSKPSWSVNTGVDGLTPFFRFEPGDARFAVPSGGEILAAEVKGAAAAIAVSAAELDEAIAEAVKTGEPVEAFSLLRAREAEAKVEINPEKTRAALFLRKGVAGALPLDMKKIARAVKDSEVSGFDAEKLKTDVHAFMEGKELELNDYLLVEGAPSTRGEDRKIEVLATTLSEDEKSLMFERLTAWSGRHTRAEDEFDPAKAAAFAFVEKGAVVASVSAGSEGEAGKDIYGNILPGLPGNDPEIKLFRGLTQHGSSLIASQSGLLLMEASEKSFRGGIVNYEDAKVGIHLSGDAMEVRGDFFREEGAGIPLTVQNVLKALAALEVTKGIDREGVEKACALAKAKGSALGQVLARGEAPVAPGGSALKWLIPLEPPELTGANTSAGVSTEADVPAETDASAEVKPGKTAGMPIKAGVPIAELSETIASGRPGFDVKGNEIPIDKGTVLSIEHDDSVREEDAGKGKRLIAARSGELIFDGRELKISSVKNIRGNAAPAAGSINFSGEVHIGGNALPGCVVIGGSHVIVDGVVEGAFISAGGKAVAAMGFKGEDKGVIRARAGVETAFTERGTVMSVGDIHLKKGSIHSTIKTNGKLYITAENGKLSGGICQARRGIDAADIGSKKGVRTEISFGQDYVIKEQIGVCEEEIAETKRVLEETGEKIKATLQKKLPLPDELREEKVRLIKILEELNRKVFFLREKFEEHHESYIRVRGSVFPGVVIESHDRYYEVQQKRSRVIFSFDRETGRIKEKPLD